MLLDEELELDGALEPLAALPLPLGVEDEPLADGVLLEPLDALPEGVLGEVLIEPLALVEPPDAESFFVASADEEELEDGELGVLGVVVEPADDEEVEPGAVVRETARSPSLSQPVRSPAPSARETATARAESLILWASVGWGKG